jgi:hypothetical protein
VGRLPIETSCHCRPASVAILAVGEHTYAGMFNGRPVRNQK